MKETNTKTERRAALAEYLISEGIANEDEIAEIAPSNYDENEFEFAGDRYLVLTDNEAQAAAEEAIINDLWAFRAEFILEHTEFYAGSTDREDEQFKAALEKLQGELCESATPIVKALIRDLDEFVEDAIDADGRGQFLALYDGEEGEAGEYFVYRS